MRIGRYELGRQLGAGGSGTVHEAVFFGPGGVSRPVAVKRVRAAGGLMREARLGGLLRHPHLVDVFEVGEHDGEWFLAMELCRDGSLAGRGPLPPRAVVEVGLHVCAALHYAHEELGLVHLDLKPQNLLLDGPVVKVADLGTAHTADRTAGASVQGTPAYMAPEHRRGDPVDARADVYALGLVLYELATGAGPLAEDTFSLSADEPERPAARTAGEGAWLEPVVARATAPDREARYASMAELAAALRALDAPGAGLAEALGVAVAAPPVRRHTNLVPEAPLVGRSAELAAVAEALREPGLTTLTGPPGVGKTAVAREAARRVHEATGDEAWFCDLGESRGLEAVLAAVGRALGVPLGAGDPEAQARQLGHALAARGRMVLVLDGFEHAVEHAPVVERWLARAPELGVLATSRQALGLAAERLVPIDVLSAADGADLVRQRALARGVDLGDDPLIDALVARLDGVPLALVLAGDRLGVLSLAEVVERLSLSLLRGGRAGQSERESTVRGAIAWSAASLDPTARAALAQLSVFRGGFTWEAADRVLALPDGAVAADVVALLVERSLVATREGRLRLLEPVRAYAEELLGDGRSAAELAHGAWLAELSSPAALDALTAHGGEERWRELGAEVENLVAGCRRAIARGDGPVAARTLTGASAVLRRTGPFQGVVELAVQVAALPGISNADRAVAVYLHAGGLAFRGMHARAREVLEQGLAMPELPTARRAAMLGVLGDMYRMAGQLDRGREVQLESLRLAGGDQRLRGAVLANLGILEHAARRHEACAEAYAAALAASREVGDSANESLVLGHLGTHLLARGEIREARRLLEEAVRMHRRFDNRRMLAISLTNLGNVALLEQPEEARRHYEEALAACREVGARHSEAIALANLGRVHRMRRDHAREAAAFQEALAAFAEVGDQVMEAVLMSPLAVCAARAGDVDRAHALLHRAEARLRPLGLALQLVWLHAARAEVHQLSGRPDEARAELALAEAASDGATEAEQELSRVREVVLGGDPRARAGHAEDGPPEPA